jgi:hypothetical protein
VGSQAGFVPSSVDASAPPLRLGVNRSRGRYRR